MIEKEIADMIDGLEYGEEIRPDIIEYAKKNGAVIVFGASDDLMEFRGAIKGEADCYRGKTVYFGLSGELRSFCDNPFCPYFDALREKASKIEAVWDSEGYSWTYKTDIPHETFEILEDGIKYLKYCRGIVLSVDAVGPDDATKFKPPQKIKTEDTPVQVMQ